VTLALSGGVDSIAALDLLARLAPVHPFTLSCLHVNHGISPNAGDWARFARAAATVRVALRSEGRSGAASRARLEG
jgi:tRNA(Ile)-lysidine synthase TilS/MesJ